MKSVYRITYRECMRLFGKKSVHIGWYLQVQMFFFVRLLERGRDTMGIEEHIMWSR